MRSLSTGVVVDVVINLIYEGTLLPLALDSATTVIRAAPVSTSVPSPAVNLMSPIMSSCATAVDPPAEPDLCLVKNKYAPVASAALLTSETVDVL